MRGKSIKEEESENNETKTRTKVGHHRRTKTLAK